MCPLRVYNTQQEKKTLALLSQQIEPIAVNLLLQQKDSRTVFTIQRPRLAADGFEAAATWHSKPATATNLPITKTTTALRYCNFYKMQSYAFLLIFLCAIVFQNSSAAPVTSTGQRLILHTSQYRLRHHQQLLQQRRQQIEPTPAHHHHHLHLRSVSEMEPQILEQSQINGDNNISNDFCKNADHLKNMLVQVNKTYGYIYSLLGEYTNSQHKKTPEDLHITWMMHMFQLEHPFTEVLERDFYKPPKKENFLHIINNQLSKEMIHTEMQKVYTTLRILKNAIDFVIKNRKENKIQLLHDLHNDRSNFKKIDRFFEEVSTMVNVDMHEVIKFMEKLDIPLPQVKAQIEYHTRTEVRDWLLASEHLSVTQYLRVLYKTLLEKCPEVAE